MIPIQRKYFLLPPVLILGLLLLYGCAPTYVWQHPEGLGEAELNKALAQCEQIAQDEVDRYNYLPPYSPPYYPPYDGLHHFNPYYDDFYFSSPYYYDSQRRFFDKQRLFRVCMQAKGWKQVPVKKSQ